MVDNVCESPAEDQTHRLLAGSPGRAGGHRTGPTLTLSSAFRATQHLATPSSTCTCPRRLPISVMMLMAESYLGKAVCTARWGWGQAGPGRHPLPHILVTSPPGPHGSGECQQSRAGRGPAVAGPRAAGRSSSTPVREAGCSGLFVCPHHWGAQGSPTSSEPYTPIMVLGPHTPRQWGLAAPSKVETEAQRAEVTPSGHLARKRQSWDLNPGGWDFRDGSLPT